MQQLLMLFLSVVLLAPILAKPVVAQLETKSMIIARRVLELERAALTQSGGVAFKFEYHNHHDISEIQTLDCFRNDGFKGQNTCPSGDVNFGCFIGGAGEIYTHGIGNDRYTEQPNRVPDGDYKRAVKLAKSLHYLALKTRNVGANLGTGLWTVMAAGEVTLLKESGNSVGELSEPNAVELVKMIGEWCPYAADNLKLEQIGTQHDN